MSVQRQSAPRTMLDLGEIIHLYPVCEPWCAGFAPSKGRRCQIRTNASMRRTAVLLLDLGSKQLRAGQCVDDVLHDLAPCVLCTRYHQNQAQSIVTAWKRRVRRFWSAQAAALATASPHQSNRRPPSFGVTWRDSPQTSVPSTASSSRNREHHRTEISHLAANSSNASDPRPPTTTSMMPERSNSLSNTSSMLLREAEEPTCDPATVIVPRGHAHRRLVEGDCSICIEPITRLDGNATSRIDGNESRELVWCKRSCGHNFHKACIDSWIAQPRAEGRQASCPMCRVSWQE